ncbi:VCBS repeat-containing protein [Defluviimonas sp. WL0002]|uniref:VCBS repeat-containing protein n=1 Tax=Albidovulum marisflavi TaxID=2984159 RepID=A0ABT2ZAV3_9RHOB|nr:VCBS repeat-containing protein [Defluviimonas sp. WL0002]MCV2868239.1 VCBS repeat-containing protein [Defluviimonas sp. WL0002]
MIRGAALALVLAGSPEGASATITQARFDEPTTRYDHGVLGDEIEYGALVLTTTRGPLRIRLPEDRVFEDIAPRLADLDADGAPEVIVVETDIERGARLSVYGEDGLIAATPYIGTRHRWLAPVGAADVDGDGRAEIAYVETPHLGKILKVVRLEGDRLLPVAQTSGMTNHRIGDAFIQGGIALCGGRLVFLTADADWSRVMATELVEGRLRSHSIGTYRGAESLEGPQGCS